MSAGLELRTHTHCRTLENVRRIGGLEGGGGSAGAVLLPHDRGKRMEIVDEPQSAARGSTIESVVAAAIEDFRSGRYAPGQRLIEADLVDRYKVGRGTIREAIKRLSGEGLVTVHPYRGASIRTLSQRELLDILSVLEVLNGLAARQAALVINEADKRTRFLAAVESLFEARARGKFYDAVRTRETFFNIIAELGGNRELDRVLPRLQLLIARVQFPNVMPEMRRYEDYRILADAILAGDGDFAEHAARRHMRHAIAGLLTMERSPQAGEGN